MKTIFTTILSLLFSVAIGQTLVCHHIFTSQYFYDDTTIVCKLRYAKNSNSTDTLYVGKQKYFIFACGDFHGWEKGHKFKANESHGDGYALCQPVNPKNGRTIWPIKYKNPKSDWYWLIYLDDMCGHKLNRLTYVNFKTNQYIAYIK